MIHESLGYPLSNEPSKTGPAALTQHVAFENTIVRKKKSRKETGKSVKESYHTPTQPHSAKRSWEFSGNLRESALQTPCPWDTHYQFSIKTLLSSVFSETRYSRLQIVWHRILRLFLKTFNSVPGVPGFSRDLSLVALITQY